MWWEIYFEKKLLLHWIHWYGISPVCVLMFSKVSITWEVRNPCHNGYIYMVSLQCDSFCVLQAHYFLKNPARLVAYIWFISSMGHQFYTWKCFFSIMNYELIDNNSVGHKASGNVHRYSSSSQISLNRTIIYDTLYSNMYHFTSHIYVLLIRLLFNSFKVCKPLIKLISYQIEHNSI